MAKLKKATLSMNNKEKSFAYEIIGILSLLISFISIAKFGLIGKYLVLSFSLLFGDWYFLFIGLVGLFGIYCLVFHKKIELKSIRYYGILLILLSLLIVSHFGMHEYVSQFEGNALKTTMSLYFDYFKSNSTSMIKGGGIIGSILFYVSYFLLGKVGTILISIFIMFIGIVFLSKKTIREFVESIIKLFKKIFKFIKNKFDNVIDNVKEISKDYNNKHKVEKEKKITLKKSSKNQEEIFDCEKNVNILTDCFKYLNVDVENITYLICEHIIVYFIKTKQDVNYKVLEYSLRNKLYDNFLIKYDKYNDMLLLEINRKNGSSLTFKKARKEVLKDKNNIILGIDDRNLIVEQEDNLLVVCSNINFLTRYILSIALFYSLQKKNKYDNLKIVDCLNCFNEYQINKFDVINDINYLDNIVEEIDQNLELLNLHHKKDIDEYNLYYQKKIIKKKYIIYGIEKLVYKQGYFDKLLYIVQTGSLAGINVILTASENISLSSILLSSIDQKLILKNDFDFVKHLIDNSYFEILNNNIEGFYKDKDLIVRISLLLMNDEEKNVYLTKKTS